MRNLHTLALLSLAAASHAIPTASATSTTSVQFALSGLNYSFAPTSANLPGRNAGSYIYDYPLDGTNVPATHNPYYEYTNDAGETAPVADPSRHIGFLNGSAAGALTGSESLTLTLTAAASASFMATASDSGDQFVVRRYGYRYFMEITNDDLTSAHDATFTFTVLSRLIAGTVDAPYDFARGMGQAAEAQAAGGVFDTALGDKNDYDAYDNTTLTASGTGFSDSPTYLSRVRSFRVPQATLDSNGALVPGFLELELYSNAYVGIEDDRRPAPVPEPAAFLPLGLGALALRRRRRVAR